MFDDENVIIIGVYVATAFLCLVGWIAAISFSNTIKDMVTELPTGCILYEEKIWCEAEE